MYYLLAEWVVRLGFLATVPFSQTSAGARNWLVFAFFLPIPALVLYALIGRTGEPRLRQKRVRSWDARRDAANASAADQCLADEGDYARAMALGAYPARRGNAVTLHADYDDAIGALVADIDAAHQRVLITAYIFATDTTGQTVIDALCRAARRGVQCHVLVDAIGSRQWITPLTRSLRQDGVAVSLSNRFLPWRGGTGRIDRRNHRKLYVIDEKVAYLGSQNLVARDFVPGAVNFELLARIEGPAAATAGLVALGDWFVNTGEELGLPIASETIGSASVQIMPSGPDEPHLGFQSLLSSAIARANRSIIIASPYTVLDEAMIQALVTSAASGVRTTLIVSAVVDKPLVRLAQDNCMAPLLSAGVRVCAFKDGLLHAKYVLIDDSLAIIGSSNSDIRSFRINSEAGMLTVDPAAAAHLADIARGHIAASELLTPAAWARRPRWRPPLERLAGLVAPLL